MLYICNREIIIFICDVFQGTGDSVLSTWNMNDVKELEASHVVDSSIMNGKQNLNMLKHHFGKHLPLEPIFFFAKLADRFITLFCAMSIINTVPLMIFSLMRN